MYNIKIFLFFLVVANYFNHASNEDNKYEETFEYDDEAVKNFINNETKKFLEEINKDKKEECKITIDGIKNFDKKIINKNENTNQEIQTFSEILKKFTTILQEQNNKRTKKEYSQKKPCCIKVTKETKKGIMVTSDTHAEADKVEKIWYHFDTLKQKEEVDKMIFLGDYGDRGPNWVYTYFLLAAMAEKYGEDILFIRGNHEDLTHIITDITYFLVIHNNYYNPIVSNCWKEMPLIGEIEYNNKKIFCSHGAMPINSDCIWENPSGAEEYFLANWNSNDYDEEQATEPKFNISRKLGYWLPIKIVFNNMKTLGYEWSIHGHEHCNKCGVTADKKRRVVTVVANKYYYDKTSNPQNAFLPAVYIINEKNPEGKFFNILKEKNKKLKQEQKNMPKNKKILGNCIIYEYDFNDESLKDHITTKKNNGKKGKNEIEENSCNACCEKC